jgi:hypothetical protein
MSKQSQTNICLSDSVHSAREILQQGIITYPERWKCQYAHFYHCFCTPSFFQCRMGPMMGLQSSHSHFIIHGNLPFYSMPYVQLQIVLLYSQEHEVDSAAGECISSLVNKISTTLARLVHSCKTLMSIVRASWLTKSSLSKHTTDGDPLRSAR